MATMKHEGVLKYVDGDGDGNINILYPAIGEEITQEKFNDLPEEDKLSGTYWIEDGEGGSGGASIDLDPTLSVEGKAADAKAVGDAISVQFNDSTGCLKVLKDGQWIETNVRAYSDKEYLIESGINNDKVSKYSGDITDYSVYANPNNATLTAGDGVMTFSITDTVAVSVVSLMSNNLYDLTYYTKLVLHCKTSYRAGGTGGLSDGIFGSSLFVTDTKQNRMTPACLTAISTATSPAMEGKITLDISAVVGEYYIGIRSAVSGDTLTIAIYDWYLE